MIAVLVSIFLQRRLIKLFILDDIKTRLAVFLSRYHLATFAPGIICVFALKTSLSRFLSLLLPTSPFRFEDARPHAAPMSLAALSSSGSDIICSKWNISHISCLFKFHLDDPLGS